MASLGQVGEEDRETQHQDCFVFPDLAQGGERIDLVKKKGKYEGTNISTVEITNAS